eukprot:3059578-Pyramimonas_sp.AAC.1
MVALLPKPAGGWRPIGLFSSAYRLWGRMRRPYAVQWEARLNKSHLSAGAFTGAGDVVWKQAVRSEHATSREDKKGVACSVLWDLH